jgi:hypothetical protein
VRGAARPRGAPPPPPELGRDRRRRQPGRRVPTHHRTLVPHGDRALVGNPDVPDGLVLVGLDQLTAEQCDQLGLPPPRAQPRAG